jgi:ClpP class serine protease
MTETEHAIFQALIDEVYQEFRGIVLENRGNKLNMALFENVTDGRILSGRQAYRAGLVDDLGTKKDAIQKAADLAGIEYEEPEDIRTCPIESGLSEGGLFGVDAIFQRLKAEAGIPSLSYK